MLTLTLVLFILVLAIWIALPALIWPAAREARLAAVPLASALTGVLVVAAGALMLGTGIGTSGASGIRGIVPEQGLAQALLLAGFAQVGLAGLGLIATGAGWRRLAVTGASAAHLGIGLLITGWLLPGLVQMVDAGQLSTWLAPLHQGGLALLAGGLLAMVLALVFRLVGALTGG